MVEITVEQMRELDERIGEMVARGEFAEGKGMRNAYVCGDCFETAVTVNRNAGTTPMWKSCPWCGGRATSRMYRIDQDYPAFFEWYRPMSESEIADVLAECDHEDYVRHICRGGLVFRSIW